MERRMGLNEMCYNLLLGTLTDLMHYPRDHSPQLDLAILIQLYSSILRTVTHQSPFPTFGDDPLHQELSIHHGNHDVVGQRVDGLVHDQDIAGVDPGIDHGFPFNPDKEGCGGILDEELVEVYGLVNGAVCWEWWASVNR